MKTTFLKASKTTAESVAVKLLSYKNKNDKPLFSKVEIKDGFEIRGKKKNGDAWEDVTVFRYVNDNGRQKFDYDERLLTF